jgi:large subunit ribosomal protein L13
MHAFESPSPRKLNMKTFSPTPSDVNHEWYIVDATGKTLGRMATEIASRLRGKHKPTYATHMDMGDFIIVTNAEKVKVTGKKTENKMYYRHTGYPGGLKTTNFAKLQAEHPERIVELAVKRMLPRNPLGRDMYRKLKVYAGDKHPHEAQQPKVLDIKGAA